MNKFKVDIDYERQSFEDMNSNPYEVIIAASKYAREINDKVRKYFGSDFDVQPRNLAMKKVERNNGETFYSEENEEEPGKKPV